jgi:hypothetical protein
MRAVALFRKEVSRVAKWGVGSYAQKHSRKGSGRRVKAKGSGGVRFCNKGDARPTGKKSPKKGFRRRA